MESPVGRVERRWPLSLPRETEKSVEESPEQVNNQ
jgi:hypothetical protein